MLFTDNFPAVNTPEELDKLKEMYPKYDRGYICQGACPGRADIKKWMEELWKQYKPFADKNFLTAFKIEYPQRSWELFVGVTLLNGGYRLAPTGGKGPDFEVRIDQLGNRRVLIEAIAPQKGNNKDKVPNLLYEQIQTVPEKQMLLRISSALSEKYRKYFDYKSAGRIKGSDSYVIAVSGASFGHPEGLIPNVLKVLFGIGDYGIKVPIENEYRGLRSEGFWNYRLGIQNGNDSFVGMNFFSDKLHNEVSAVIYCHYDIINSVKVPEKMGAGFVTVVNPHAANPLPEDFPNFGKKYVVQEDGKIIDEREVIVSKK